MKDIQDVLVQLDTLDDAIWTADGQPKLDAVKELLGRAATRAEIVAAAPHFNRSNPIIGDEEAVLASVADESLEQPLGDEDAALPVDGLIEEFLSQAPMERNEFLVFLSAVPTSQLKDLEEAVQKQQIQIREARRNLDEAELKVNNSLVFVQSRISVEIPDISETQANQNFLKAQMELRAKRKAAQIALLQGVDLSVLDPRSPLDRAFARRTQRGTQRPGT